MAKQTVTIKSHTTTSKNYVKTTKIKRTKSKSNPLAKRMHPTTDCCVHRVHSK